MTKYIWPKTILSAYRYLERICDAIDRLVESKALNSFYMGGTNFSNNNISVVADKLIELGQRKVTLINLKIVCEMALQKCKDKHSEILIEKYVDCEKAKDIAQRHDMTMRTYFRRLSSADIEFSANLNMMGYSDKKLAEDLAGEQWICEIYKRYFSKQQDLDLSDCKIDKLALC